MPDAGALGPGFEADAGRKRRPDGRTRAAQRVRRAQAALISRVGARAAHPEISALVRTASLLVAATEAMADRMAQGEQIAPEAVTGLSSELRRVLSRLGLPADAAPEDDPQRLLDEMLAQIAATPGPP